MILRDTLTPEEQRAYEKLPVPFCVFLIRGESFTLLALSDGFCESFHARREEFSAPLIEVLRRCVHPDDLQRVEESLGATLNLHGWRLRGDPSLHHGGCKVSADEGDLDASVATRWQELCRLAAPGVV